MADSTPARLTRKQREQRAYRLSYATGGGALATVVSLLLAVFGVVSAGLVVLLAVLTAACGFALKRTLSR